MERRTIVTGGLQGIGESIVGKLREEGYFVIIADVNVKKEELKENEKLMYLHCDISDYHQVSEMMLKVKEKLGGFDVLVNNAGITKDVLFEKMSIEQWHDVINVNLNGTFYCCREAIQYLKLGNQSRIINIASLSGIFVNKGQANYGVSKAAVIELTKYLAVELAPYNILVNAVAPGMIDTDMVRKIDESVLKKIIKVIPQKRLGTVEEIAKVVSILADPELSYVTGEVIKVSGGIKV